ncbi:hypothetical protein ABEB36_004121 [Hypothenemus hampei]|uniref:Uncharacterized protein n=1 Tax=Hypothenemus hampei TaxID=57062 RepID=A0ABD1F5E0_HYPHA
MTPVIDVLKCVHRRDARSAQDIDAIRDSVTKDLIPWHAHHLNLPYSQSVMTYFGFRSTTIQSTIHAKIKA